MSLKKIPDAACHETAEKHEEVVDADAAVVADQAVDEVSLIDPLSSPSYCLSSSEKTEYVAYFGEDVVEQADLHHDYAVGAVDLLVLAE